MSSFTKFQEGAKSAALALLAEGPTTMETLQTTYVAQFPPPTELLSVTRQKFDTTSPAALVKNPSVETMVSAALDVAGMTLTNLGTIEQYVTLTIPKMEDGNNFGVTVQLAALKHIHDTQETLMKQMEEVCKYYTSRADAIEKCKQLGTTTQSSTKSQGTSKSIGTGTGEGENSGKEIKKNSSSEETKTDEKTVESKTTAPDGALRAEAVTTGVDLLYYTKAKALYQSVMTGYCATLDFLEKNSEKIGAPKGAQGSSSAFHSMY